MEKQTETPGSVTTTTVEEPKVLTLAEVEKQYHEKWDKDRGRDMDKLFPGQVKKEEPKTEVKVEAKTETKVEPAKADEPVVRTKADRDLGKLRARLREEKDARSALEARLAAIESKDKPVVKTETVTITEPKREAYTTDAEYFEAVRKFDKEQQDSALKKVREDFQKNEEAKAWDTRVADFQARIAAAKAKHEDWDTIAANTKVVFEPGLLGVIMDADPELLYHFAKNPADAKQINKLSEIAVVAVSNADDVTSVLRYLSSHPDDVAKLSVMHPVKAQNYIGKIEARIEVEAATSKKDEAVKTKAEEVKASTSSGESTTQITASGADTTKVQRVKPELPQKLSGGVPSSKTYSDPESMSLKEREMLMMQDPKYARRRG
jgi:PHD/YefM family antitoxin component YafN of YafNO toxin-antitoxin module